jgi:hypothetical protein|tara:strand:+ start:2065 stop:2289 length:225 start_codon:yes stop_codon:yes gene_type:complete
MSIIKDIIEREIINTLSRNGNYTKNSDGYLKYCTKCRKVWENNSRIGGSSKDVINYYDDFPTYGKKREICRGCK